MSARELPATMTPSQMREPTADELAGPKGWAWRLRQREINGDRLGVCQRQFWREALQVETGAEGGV